MQNKKKKKKEPPSSPPNHSHWHPTIVGAQSSAKPTHWRSIEREERRKKSDRKEKDRVEREQRKGETGNENEKDKKKRKWAPLNKKIIYSLQLVNSMVSNMRLHCLSIAKIIPFKIFDEASFWVKNAKKKKKDF